MSAVLSSATTHIELWCTRCDELRTAALLERYLTLLDREELEQLGQFRYAKDRDRYLITRAMQRVVLSRYVELPPEQWQFTKNKYGRPEIVNHQDGNAISFNLSHSENLIVMGVAYNAEIGVDTEFIEPTLTALQLAKTVFSDKEAAALANLHGAELTQRFYQYWTLKEAYIKARGMGLALPLDKAVFDFADSEKLMLSLDPVLSDQSARWHCWQFRLFDDYAVAVCAERRKDLSRELVVRKIAPLESEQFIPYSDCWQVQNMDFPETMALSSMG